MMKKVLVVAIAALFAADASGQIVPKDEFNTVVIGATETATAGSSYFYTPGLGGAGGFALAMMNPVDSIIDGLSETVGVALADTDGSGAADPVISTDTQSLAAGCHTLQLNIMSLDDLAPGGFTVGGATADVAAVFLGANAGGTPLSFDFPPIVKTATVELFDVMGASLAGPFDISSFANFTAGPGGSWDGSAGVSFGAGSAGLGIAEYELIVTYVPEPTTACTALLGLLGLSFLRRR